MRVAIALFALASSSAAIAVACGSETPASPTATDGGTTPNDTGAGTDTGTSDVDSGVRLSPSGCVLKTTDYIIGKKAENIPRTDGVTGTADWIDVDGALSEDGKFASVTLAEGQESSSLRVSDFGLAIPATAETWGIVVELKRRAPDGGVEDSRIDVEIEGKETRFKFLKTGWPVSIVGIHHYGQAVDTWGIDLLPLDVNKPTFAAKISVKRAANTVGPVTAIVDSLKVAVHFCPVPAKK